MIKSLTAMFAGAVALLAAVLPVQARDAEVYTGIFSTLAVGGYDAVAYFKDNKPVKGSPAFTFDYKGAKWQFASADNLATFKANPTAYAPQYGGYCAWAVSQGYTASGDPLVWNIVNGRLFLNYDKSVQATWSKDIPGHIVRADKNWPGVLGK
jgi:YHS domain-containing protein